MGSLTAIMWSYYIQGSGYEVCLLLWCAEFTNPFLQLRWCLRCYGYHQSLLGKLNEFLFACVFVAMRGGFGLVYTYQVYLSATKTDFIMRCFGYSFQVVNFLFLIQIWGLAKKRVFGESKKEINNKAA